MEALEIIWSFFLLFSIFAFSLLMGVLLFFRLRRFHFLAHLVGTLVPFVLFILFSWLTYIYAYYRANPDDRCGGQAMAALGIISIGTLVLIVVSPFAQWVVHATERSHRTASAVSGLP